MTPAEELREAATRLHEDAARLAAVADLKPGGSFLAAVAGLLDATAEEAGAGLEDAGGCHHGPSWGHDRCGGTIGANCDCWDVCHCFDNPLAVARAYLAPVLREAQGTGQ